MSICMNPCGITCVKDCFTQKGSSCLAEDLPDFVKESPKIAKDSSDSEEGSPAFAENSRALVTGSPASEEYLRNFGKYFPAS